MSKLIWKNFKKINDDEKKLILSWRNSDRIRLKMSNQNIITLEDHFKWVESLKTRTDCSYSLVILDDKPIAVTNLIDINYEEKSAWTGYYVGDTAFAGYGIPIQFYGNMAFFEFMKFNTLYANVLRENKRVYKMHKKYFYAKDMGENDKEYLIYFDKESWKNVKSDFYDKMEIVYGIVGLEFIE